MGNETVEVISQKIEELKKGKAPVFIHCGSGRRAGAMALLHLAAENGWTVERAFEEAQRLGFDYESEPQIREFFEKYIGRHSIKKNN